MRPLEKSREDERLRALDRYDILDTRPEAPFDRLTRMAQKIFEAPIVSISFIDSHRQWFKSRQGLPFEQTCKKSAFCSVTIAQEDPLIVPDTLADDRFKTNPYVSGSPGLRFYAGAQLRTPDGHNIGTLCLLDTKPRPFGKGKVSILRDLADIVMSELDLRLRATTDCLTGTLSRRAFREEAMRAILLAMRHRYPLSCFIFDLDHFKAVNDANGHAVGDLVLQHCAEACREALRKSDILGRIGGEEFGVILPHTKPVAAMRVAEKARTAIEQLTLPGRDGPVRISASFGIAEFDPTAPEMDELLRRADMALFAAKEAGRNRCQEWHNTHATQTNVMRRVLKAGRIEFNSGASVVDCTIRALSRNGAYLEVVDTANVPEMFKLKIEADGSWRSCNLVSKEETRLRVGFS